MLQACVYRVSVVGLVVACGCAMSACSTMGSRKPLPSREASRQAAVSEQEAQKTEKPIAQAFAEPREERVIGARVPQSQPVRDYYYKECSK